MKRLNLNKIILTLILLTATLFRTSSQCMMEPLSLDNRVDKSSAIVEGIVTGQRTTWDDGKKRIYTIYTIGVTSVFKGNAPATIEMAMPGGTVGDMTMTATSAFRLGKGSAGIFMMEASRQRIASRSKVYDCYSGAQGFLRYDRSNRSASGVFDKYASVENNLYPLLESKTGHARQVRKAFVWDNNSEAQRGSAGNSDLAHSLTSFSPTTTTAGTSSVLTIYGSGFGSSQGSSYVQFENADDGGDTYISASSYTSWSDTEIKVTVPSGAGTGKVKVIVNGSTKTSSGTLTINYNLNNSGGVFAKMINDNGNGGYTFQMHSDFASSSGGSVFTTSVNKWICNVNVNWTVSGATTSIDEVAYDGVNVVRWDHDDLSSGTLGVAYTYYSCNETVEVDMVFNEDKHWYFNTGGNCPSDKFDFYSVALHELGHTCSQGHVIKSGDMMHYSISKGQDNEDFVQEITINGGLDAVNRSQSGWCSSGMVRMYCSTPTVTLSTGTSTFSNETGSTTITATLSSTYYNDVTVYLGLSGTATSGSDYTIGSTTLVIYAGQTSASTTVTCTNDALDEDNETIIIDISSVTNGTENGTQQKTITINDNDATPTVTLSTPVTSVTEGNGSYFDITATLSAASGRDVYVYLGNGGTATSTSDYFIFIPQTYNIIRIAAGQTTGTAAFVYQNDALYEVAETAIIGIDSIEDGYATENGVQQFTVTINDNDTKPTVSLSASGTGFFETGITGVGITATLSEASGVATTVNLGFSGTATYGTDYNCAASITIPAGSTSATITISVIDDAIDEDNETTIVDITSVTNATENGTQQKNLSIIDDDNAPNVSIAWSNTSIGEGPAGTSNAIATLSAVSGKTVTVNLSFTGTATLNSDFTVTGSSITIPAGSTSGYISMNNITDTLNEGNEYVTVNMTTVTNATKVNPQSATMTINDDDDGSTGRTVGSVVSSEKPKAAEVIMDVVAGPNPFTTQFTVRNLTSASTMQLADMNGVIISTVKVNNSTMTINTSSLKAGVYFLKINGANNGQKQTIKLVKQ